MAKKQMPKKTDDYDFDSEDRDESEDMDDAEGGEGEDSDVVPDLGDELDDDLLQDVDSDIEDIDDVVDEDLPPVVGGEVDSFCTKCKRISTHTVVSILRGRPAKVLCNVCESQHQYRTAAPEPSQSRSRGTPRNRAIWEEALQRVGEQAIPYLMNNRYEEEQVIQHPSFGKGVVVRTYDQTKMEVLFEDQVRRLVHNRT